MNRRAFLGTVAGSLLAAPRTAEAQPRAKHRPRIGFLGNASPGNNVEPVEAFREGLRERGWFEGRTVDIEYRWASGDHERLAGLAEELVRSASDVIVVSGSVGTVAARDATHSIPIVIAAVLTDPVAAGFVTSLAHPGGNITGLAASYEEITTKQLQLLTEALPGLTRLVFLWNLLSARRATLDAVITAAQKLGLRPLLLEVRDVGEAEAAYRKASQGRAQAVHVRPSPFFNSYRRTLIDLAARYHLPAMYEFRDYVRDGGLMSYGVRLGDMYRRAADYVDRILKGANPADMPVEQPTKFELAINIKTAKTLGLMIPPSLLQRADQVIE
jgi:putative tryptophan/tyrosine transport system substrate-binding protein